MSAHAESIGLCLTCKNAPGCTFPSAHKRPVFYCEEFEIEKTPPGGTAVKDGLQSTDSNPVRADDSTRFFGLCSDCEGRNTCVFPRPEGGVWHCEEYQ